MLTLALALAMATPNLTLRAEAKGKPTNDDLFITLTITNSTNDPIPIPLEFLQKSGPSVKLTDTRTKTHTYLRTNLADPALRQKLTPIPAHKSVKIEWLIHPAELEQFGTPIDLTATFTLHDLTTTLQITTK